MILLSELSRRRIRSINKLIRVGKNELAMVIRVDKDKSYIDLSKRRVSAEDVVKAEERFNKAKAVHSTLRHVSNRLLVPMAQLYRRVAWPLYRKFGHAYGEWPRDAPAASSGPRVRYGCGAPHAHRPTLLSACSAAMPPLPAARLQTPSSSPSRTRTPSSASPSRRLSSRARRLSSTSGSR